MLDTAIPIPYWFELSAIMTGGLSGAMSAVRAKYDIFGCVFIACLTGMGGGMVRDVLLLNYGIYAFQNPSLLLSCAIAGVVVFYFGKLATYLDPIVDLLDNLSVALWAIIGTAKSLSAGLDIVPAIMLGTITACGGGIMRDITMSKTPTAFLAGPLYGSAAFFGCTAFALMRTLNFFSAWAPAVCAVLVLGIRYGSLIFGWTTRPPKDYSDAVVNTVAKPVRFMARKAHVPLGKTARDRGENASRIRVLLRRFYNRISGRWMDLQNQGSSTDHHSSTEGEPTDSQNEPTQSEDTDRIFVDREELHQFLNQLDVKSDDDEPIDPFQPKS